MFSGRVREIVAIVDHGVFIVWIWGRLWFGQAAAITSGKAGIADKIRILLFQRPARGVRQRGRGQDGSFITIEV